MKKNAKFLFLSVFVGFISMLANGTNYYVDASNGNNSNQGTEVEPWLTIQHAANTMVAGDTVYVREGTYFENIILSNSGSNGQYITYQNYPGEHAVIDASGGERGIDIYNGVDYIKIIGLEIKNATSLGITTWEGRENSYITIKDCNIHNNGNGNGNPEARYQGGIAFHAASGDIISYITLDNNKIHHNYYIGIFIYSENYSNSANNIVIANNLVYRNPEIMNTDGDNHPLYFWNVSNSTVHDNYFYFAQKSPRMSRCSDNNTIYNNVFAYCGEVGFGFNNDCDNNVIENNIFAYNNIHGFVTKNNGADNNLLLNNIFYRNGYCNIYQLNSSTGTGIQNNIFCEGISEAALIAESGNWGIHDYNDYYGFTYAQNNGTPLLIGDFIGPGNI